MDENEIQEQLKKNIPKEEPDTTTRVVDEGSKELHTPNVDLGDDMLVYKLYDFFRVDPADRSDPVLANQVSTIYRWADERAGGDYIKLMEEISWLKGRLGLWHKEDALGEMYRFVRLDRQRKEIETEMNLG